MRGVKAEGGWAVVSTEEVEIHPSADCEPFHEGRLWTDEDREFDARHLAIATGARWRRDGVGRENGHPIPGFADSDTVLTPDDLMEGRLPQGPVVIFDDDHCYMGGVLAERCVAAGLQVTLVTPASIASAWTANTLEALPIARRLARLGVAVITNTNIESFSAGRAILMSRLTGESSQCEARSMITVTARLPNDPLYRELEARLGESGLDRVRRVGDCYGPGAIQAAVYSGHKYARELDTIATVHVRRELPSRIEA
jgi:dimethylamine/trimethylamine dehydrogenase